MKAEESKNSGLLTGSPEITLGDSSQKKKVLVAYATAYGSTGGVAEAIGVTLAESEDGGASFAVDVRPVQSVTNLDDYSAVILGSAVHGGKWLPEAVAFLKANQARLNQIPTAFFLVGLMANKKDEGTRKLIADFLIEERALVKPVEEGQFAGALNPKKHPGIEGFGIRFFAMYCGLGFNGGDSRDPAAIRAWAHKVRPLLNL
jgi:menaquinone-dependent protoporphyrinogen oxidase